MQHHKSENFNELYEKNIDPERTVTHSWGKTSYYDCIKPF